MKFDQVAFFHCGNTEHLKHAKMMVESVRHHLGDVWVVQVGDDGTSMVDGVNCQLILENCSPDALMLDNIRAQLTVVSNSIAGCRTLFIDTDVLVTGSLEKAFEEVYGTWDVAVTWRPPTDDFTRAMPYNYGVMAFRTSMDTVDFLSALLNTCAELEPGLLRWYGNQRALYKMLGDPTGEATLVGQTRVALYPCLTHNYSPDTPNEDVSRKHLIHLKGPRKGWMQHYAKRTMKGEAA